MPIVLVVDDSPVDQKLVGGLLQRDIDWLVEFSHDVDSALAMIRDVSPDLVVTDLQMPGRSGLDLIREGREKFPHIPIVLITGKGSEQLAVEALQAGAASYVPKQALSDDLCDTVERMLKLAAQDRNKERLMNLTTNCRFQFKIDSDLTLIPPLVEFVRDSIQLLRLADPVVIRHVSVAVEEAMANAILHGNLEMEPNRARASRHALPGSEDYELLQERMGSEPFTSRKVLFGMDVTRKKCQFAIKDHGPGFDVDAITSASDETLIGESTSRGLTLIRNFMDEVTFDATGNEIRMSREF